MMTAAMCLALNMFFEARNEDIMGQIMVADVTMNRVESNHYPDNVCDVAVLAARHDALACDVAIAIPGVSIA